LRAKMEDEYRPQQPASIPRKGVKDDAQVPHEDGYLMPSLTYANKCTQCGSALSAGTAGWFNKARESGKRVTCVTCHDGNVEALVQQGAALHGESTLAPKRKMKAAFPKVDEVVLVSADGLTKLYRIAKAKRVLKKTDSVAHDLGRVLALYKDWGKKLVPALDISVILERCEKIGGGKRVRDHLLFLRDVEIGMRSLDEYIPPSAASGAYGRYTHATGDGGGLDGEEYDLGAGLEQGNGGAGEQRGAAGFEEEEPVEVTEAMRERMEAQRISALERLDAKRAEAAERTMAAAGDDEDEAAMMEAEMMGGMQRGSSARTAPATQRVAYEDGMDEDESAAMEMEFEMAQTQARKPTQVQAKQKTKKLSDSML